MYLSEEQAGSAYRDQFQNDPRLIASAPGRVNLIGEHTDYNQGLVLPCAVQQRVGIAIGPGKGRLYSVNFSEEDTLQSERHEGWAAYPRGVVWALQDAGYAVPEVQAAIAGNVPTGSGLSSSAAIEAATATALNAYAKLGIPQRDLALLCQRAENVYVGVNSGIMDQYASILCKVGEALLIDCRSLDAESVPLDLRAAELALQVCDTRVERSLGSTAYNERRATSERAAKALGLSSLRDATLEDLSGLNGEELKRARHVVTENLRVLAAVEALRRSDFEEFGRLMDESHASLRDDYEVSVPELNVAVETARENGALGARLTGAGFGGCTVALVRRKDEERIGEAIMAAFAQHGFRQPVLYHVEPSNGASVAGNDQ